jgi:hypothetical protein
MRKLQLAMAVAVACTIFFSSLVIIPNVLGQTDNVKVLSYSWYASSSNNDFIVVGEVQNTANFVLSSVSLNAAVYASDGTEIVSGSTKIFANYLLPLQKAPFYIDFGNPGSGANSTYSSVSYVDFTVSIAPETNDQMYEGLSLNPAFSGVVEGAYIVLGAVNNNGNQTAKDIVVVATYYNNAGTVVAVGFNNLTSTFTSNNSTTFTLSEYDATPNLVAQISNYSLLVQTSTLQSNSLSSPSSLLSSSSLGSLWLIYGVIGAVVIVVVAVTVLVFLRKRRNLPPPPPPPQS